MREKIKNIIIISFMVIIGVISFGSVSLAGNTGDTSYSFNNYNSEGYSTWRNKEDASKVYIHPTSGPAIFYTVQGKRSGTIIVASNKHKIYVNTYDSMSNLVNENKCQNARLKFDVDTVSPVDTIGVWSPDSTKNFTVYY